MKKNSKIFSNLKSRKFKVGSLATATTIIMVAIIVVINLIVGQVTKKFSLNLDLTQNKIFSLTDQTVNFIKNLDKDVEIILLNDEDSFAKTNSYFTQANSVLKKYTLNSNKIKITYVDVVKNPMYLNEYQNENLKENSIIVKSGNRHKIITVQDIFEIQRSYYGSSITGSKAEQELTSAILYVTSNEQTKIVFLNGYGEQEFTAFSELLKKNNFNVLSVSLLNEEIPNDASLAIIWGPERDFDTSSIDKLEKFLLLGNKNLIYAINPNQKKAPNLNAFLERHNIKVKDGMPYCRPIEGISTDNVKTLMQFSKTSGILPKGAKNDFDFSKNVSGPISSVLISTIKSDSEKDSNLAVIGSYVAFLQDYLSSNALNNSAYFINMINKMTNREDVGITIESKSLGGNELGISKANADTIGIVMAVILPITILIIGIVVFFKRKNK